ALESGAAHRRSLFEVFGRTLPPGRRYGVVAGTGRILEMIRDFRFDDAELSFLSREKIVDERTIDWLANYRFSGTIRGYAEGEVYFPGSPLLTIESTFAEGVILETLILSAMNYDCAVASAASRMAQRPVIVPARRWAGGARTNTPRWRRPVPRSSAVSPRRRIWPPGRSPVCPPSAPRRIRSPSCMTPTARRPPRS